MESRSLKMMNQSLRSGFHATVYEVRRDPGLKNKDVIRDKSKPVFPFVSGSSYKGQWNKDMKDGFGIQINTDNSKYEGEWKANKFHGRGTLYLKKGKEYIRQYVGEWVNGAMEGEGVFYYENGDIYRGQWFQNQRSGEGKFETTNGDIYIGGWSGDSKNGLGTLNYANGNVYEGMHFAGLKDGPGLFYYSSTRKIYQGEWLEDQPKCGEYRQPTNQETDRFSRPLKKGVFYNDYKLPELGLADPNDVITESLQEVRMERSVYQQSDNYNNKNNNTSVNSPNLLKAKYVFDNNCNPETNGISIYKIEQVITELGLNLDPNDIDEVIDQLEVRQTMELSFDEVLEITTYIHNKKM